MTIEKRESRRLAVLAALGLLDTPPEREFDIVVQLARNMFGCTFAAVSLIDDRRQWLKAACGIGLGEVDKEDAFCTRVVQRDEMLVVPDAALDPNFVHNLFVTGEPFLRFYAGWPIHASLDRSAPVAIGTICIGDARPRDFSAEDEASLRALAELVEALVRARSTAITAARLATDSQIRAEQLDRAQRQFRQAERMANIGSWRFTFADTKVEWSDQVFAIHGLPVGAVPPVEGALTFYPAQSRATITAAIERATTSGQPFDVEVDFVTAAGISRRVRSLGELELLNGAPVALIGVFQDVTVRYEMEQALRQSAAIDELTRLTNRAGFNRVLDDRIEEARIGGDPLALLLIDLDGFKQVNDRFGHLAGDDVLRAVAERLGADYLARCCPSRLGGDEFVLVVSDRRDTADIDGLVTRLLADLRISAPSDERAAISGTIGISWLDADVADRSALLHRADLALYAAKRAERGSARVFGSNVTIRVGGARSAKVVALRV